MEIIIEGGDIKVDILKIHQSSPFGKVTGEQLMLCERKRDVQRNDRNSAWPKDKMHGCEGGVHGER